MEPGTAAAADLFDRMLDVPDGDITPEEGIDMLVDVSMSLQFIWQEVASRQQRLRLHGVPFGWIDAVRRTDGAMDGSAQLPLIRHVYLRMRTVQRLLTGCAE